MIANTKDIIECFKAGITKKNIAAYYRISRPRLDRILKGIPKPQKKNYEPIEKINIDGVINQFMTVGLAGIAKIYKDFDMNILMKHDKFAELLDSDQPPLENINFLNNVSLLLLQGVRLSEIVRLQLNNGSYYLSERSLVRLMKRNGFILPSSSSRLGQYIREQRKEDKMDKEERGFLMFLFEKYKIYPTLNNALAIVRILDNKVIRDFNLLPCFLRKSYPAVANDYIQVLTSVVPESKIFKDSDWLNTLEAMDKFIDFTTLKSTGSKEGKHGMGFYPKFATYCGKCKKYSTCTYISRVDNEN